MHANEQKARAYIAEVTGLATGRVIASFPHSISFEVAAMTAEHLAEILERVKKVFPQAVSLDAVCVSPGRFLTVNTSSVSLYQRVEFSANLKDCMHQTWQAIYPDAGATDNDEAIELVLDADRMETNCGKKGKLAYAELDALEAVFGFDKVDKELAKKVQLV